ncbi:MAG: MFS transporter [Pseudomonadota bacterium]
MSDLGNARVEAPGRNGLFARFAAAVGLANLGDGIAVVAWAWTASLLTRDPLWIAILPATLRVPWVLFALFAGILADRADRRRLIALCDFLRAVCYGLAAAVIFISLPLEAAAQRGVDNGFLYFSLLGLGFIIGCAEVTRDNAAQTMLPALVSCEGLERANGVLGSIETVGNEMAGPAIGAFLLAVFLPAPFVAIALSFLCAAFLTMSLSGDFRASAEPAKELRLRAELLEGFRFVMEKPLLRVLVLITGLWNFFAEMALIGLILHMQENMDADATTYGIVLAIGAVGGVIGGIVVAPLLKVFGKATMMQWMGLLSTPVFLLLAFAPGPATVALALFILYLSGIIWDAVSVSYRQRVVPDEIRGRVNSVYRLFAWGTMPLGLVASGALVNSVEDLLGRSGALIVPFLVAAFGVFLLSLFSWRALGRGFAGRS